MTTTPTAEPEWTAGYSGGWRGPWDLVDEVREQVNWDLLKVEEATEAVRNQDAVQGPARPAEEVIKAITAAREYLARAERDAVRELRLRQFTWTGIGHIFGVSRQAAQKRFGGAK